MRGRRLHPWLAFSLTSLILASTTGAQAQTWLSDRKRAEGSGIRVGDLEVHPGLGAEFGYTNNVYNAEPGRELGSAMLRVAPHVFLSTLSPQRTGVDESVSPNPSAIAGNLNTATERTEIRNKPGMLKFRGGLSASLLHYFADETPATEFGVNLDLALTIAPERPVSFSLTENFSRIDQPFSDPVSTPGQAAGVPDVAPNTNFARYFQQAGARVHAQTNGGLLQGSIGYRFGYSWYQDPVFESNDYLNHTVDLTGAWEFLPKTALFYDAAYAHQDYTRNNEPVTQLRLVDNDQVFTRLGINGAITPRISGTLAGGYGVGFFGGNDFEGVTLNAEGRWTPTEVSELAVGYDRGFTSAYQGNFVRRDQIYARLRFFFGGAFVLASKLAVEFLDFGPDPTQPQQRSDRRYAADISGEYRFIDWLAVTAQFYALIDDTDFVAQAVVTDESGNRSVARDPAEFRRFEGWIGMRAFF